MSKSGLAALVEEASEQRWCTQRYCSTCGATPWRNGLRELAILPPDLAVELSQLPLWAWYGLSDIGGAIYYAFASLGSSMLSDRVLSHWLADLSGHIRIADAVSFYVVRGGLASPSMSEEWLRRSEAIAVESHDPSLLETLIYAYGAHVTTHVDLMRAAQRERRGYAPLNRALKRITESVSPET